MDIDDYEDEDEWVEDEGDDEDDDVLVCPSCRASVHEDTQQCPHCGDWITPVYTSRAWTKPLAIAVVLLLIVSLLITFL